MIEPRPIVNFFLDLLCCPKPFVLGVQKYKELLSRQGDGKKELVLVRLMVVYKEVVF